MSLIPSANAGSANQSYGIQNVGTALAPIVSANGSLAIAPDSMGNAYIQCAARAAAVPPGALHLGANPDTFNNIVLSSGPDMTTVTTPLTVANGSATVLTGPTSITGGSSLVVSGSVSTGGNLILTNGAIGGSISGYWNASTPSASYPNGADTPLANPAGITPGWYIVSHACAPGGQAEEQISTIVHFNGTLYDIGGAIQSVAGGGSFGFKPSDDRTAMRVHNSTGAAQTSIVSWAKILN